MQTATNRLREHFRDHPTNVFTVNELAYDWFPGIGNATLRSALIRLTNQGFIERTKKAHYRLVLS